jgi:hypothetical protein
MNLQGIAGRCAALTPSKPHVAVPLLVMAGLYWLSSVPGTRLPGSPEVYALFLWVPPAVQNLLHVPAYATLAWAWYWSLAAWLQNSIARTASAAFIAATYGVLDEWHQSFVPARYASFTDIVFNVIGVVLGIALTMWISRRYHA